MQGQSGFAESKTFHLAKPQVKIDSTLFYDDVLLEFEFDQENAKVEYSILGGKWQNYKTPIQLSKTSSIRIKATHPEFKESDIIKRSIIKIDKSILPKKINVNPNPNSNYKGDGINSLADFKIGDSNFRKKWLGFQSDTVDINLTLKEEVELNSLTFHVLENNGAWIFLPEKIEIYIDGKMVSRGDLNQQILLQNKDNLFAMTAFQPVKASQVLIKIINKPDIPEWHPGHGHKPWLFIDEIILN